MRCTFCGFDEITTTDLQKCAVCGTEFWVDGKIKCFGRPDKKLAKELTYGQDKEDNSRS